MVVGSLIISFMKVALGWHSRAWKRAATRLARENMSALVGLLILLILACFGRGHLYGRGRLLAAFILHVLDLACAFLKYHSPTLRTNVTVPVAHRAWHQEVVISLEHFSPPLSIATKVVEPFICFYSSYDVLSCLPYGR